MSFVFFLCGGKEIIRRFRNIFRNASAITALASATHISHISLPQPSAKDILPRSFRGLNPVRFFMNNYHRKLLHKNAKKKHQTQVLKTSHPKDPQNLCWFFWWNSMWHLILHRSQSPKAITVHQVRLKAVSCFRFAVTKGRCPENEDSMSWCLGIADVFTYTFLDKLVQITQIKWILLWGNGNIT